MYTYSRTYFQVAMRSLPSFSSASEKTHKSETESHPNMDLRGIHTYAYVYTLDSVTQPHRAANNFFSKVRRSLCFSPPQRRQRSNKQDYLRDVQKVLPVLAKRARAFVLSPSLRHFLYEEYGQKHLGAVTNCHPAGNSCYQQIVLS